MTITAVLFDLDDTLYNRGEAFQGWATGFLEATAPRLTLSERNETVAWLAAADESGYCPRPDFVARVEKRFPGAAAQSVDEFVSTFRAVMLMKIELEEGARLMIEALNARQIPWGIVTNGSAFPQQRKVDHLGLSRTARCVVISETFGGKKPLPGIFHHAAQCLQVEAANVLFIGDHVVNDIGGARKAGMQTAWLRRGRDWPAEYAATRPDHIVDDLSELVTLFEHDL